MWDKLTLYQFQQIEKINAAEGYDDLEKVLHCVCVVHGYTTHQLNETKPAKVQKMIAKVSQMFTTPPTPKPLCMIGKYRIEYDIDRITFGQYIDLNFFTSAGSLSNAHYIMATLARPLWRRKYSHDGHPLRADYFLHRPMTQVTGSLQQFNQNFASFNDQYKKLFGLDREVNGNDAPQHPFNKNYGWLFSATTVAEYERISLEEAFALPVRRALNDLAYIKARDKYIDEQTKKQTTQWQKK